MQTMYPGSWKSNRDEGDWQEAGLFGNTICLNGADESGRKTVLKKMRRKIFNLGIGPVDYSDTTSDPCSIFNKCEACPNRQMNKTDSLGRVAINLLGVLRVGAGEIGRSFSMVRAMASQVIRSSSQEVALDTNPVTLISGDDELYGSRDVQSVTSDIGDTRSEPETIGAPVRPDKESISDREMRLEIDEGICSICGIKNCYDTRLR
jgi:hypothetical protein